MDDLISRQAAIDAVKDADVVVFYDEETTAEDAAEIAIISTKKSAVASIESLPSAQHAQPKPCDLCKKYGLEDGDTLYCSADWDGGIGFDYIRDIHYCPKCGRRLGNE